MEKNQFLGPYHTVIGLIVFVVLLTSCSMPRIVLLRDPLTPEEHINLGLSYEKNGEYAAALKEYEAASKKVPIAHLYVGNLYFQKGDIDDAEKAYKLAIRKTDDPRAYNNLSWLYYTSENRLDKAEELARKAVELAPDSEDFRDTLAKIIEKNKH
jgi:tetratricopeptide (TPR) repeat protein